MQKKPSRMIVRSIAMAAVATAVFLGALSETTASQHLVFEGDVTFGDLGQYLRLPFSVPQGTTSIAVSYTYHQSSATGEAKGIFDPVIDIGVYDPEKFRGWSGSNKSSFVISESRELTTDSYLPGEIPSGQWYVELGVALIRRTLVVHYTVEIDLKGDPVGPPYVWPAKKDVVLSSEARWYMGDLHCHSTHSDGEYPMDEVFDYASSIGLDFLALTDHNSLSHLLYLGEMQANYPDLLLLRGEELTTYRGHANVFNIYRPVDYHGTAPGYDINAVIEGIHHDGAYISPNHPASPFGRVGSMYIGLGWAYPEIDWNLPDFFEVVNGPNRLIKDVPNVLNSIAILWWEGLLSAGYRITAIGGSDDHEAGHGKSSDPMYAPIGVPTTMVYADELSPNGIFEAIKAGHVYVIAEGPQGPRIEFTAQSGDQTAMVGDTIRGKEIEFRVEISGGKGRTLAVWKDGAPLIGHDSVAIDQDPFEYTFTLRSSAPGRVRLELQNNRYLSAVTNPIYFAPEAPFWGPAQAQASTIIQGSTTNSDIANSILSVIPSLALLLGWKGIRRSKKRCH